MEAPAPTTPWPEALASAEAALAAATRLVNPLGMSVLGWAALLVAKCSAEAALDAVVVTALWAVDYAKLPSRTAPTKTRGLERLEPRDWVFLALNQLIEAVFLHHLFDLMLRLPRGLDDVTFLNTVVAAYATFLLDDFFYYWLHRVMHLQFVYALVHKHHHRQSRAFFAPSRDAAVERR